MGRTNPTYRDVLNRLEDDWKPFRRGLRRRRKGDFDRLFAKARQHADAAGYLNATDPELVFLLSVVLAQEAELQALRDRLEDDDAADL